MGRLPVLGVLMALAPSPSAAQDALVLSTGGSRGITHAGALVGLQEIGYDPGLVVGNSMGAVVGSLYASGLEPDELRRRMEAIDWGDVFMPMPLILGHDRALRFPMLRLGIDLGPLELSRGFTPDWRVNRLLVHLLFDAGARARGDFDRLPRRLRVVMADLASGEPFVVSGGDLPRAVRASMGTPGFFTPIEWDGHLLTDGGIADYLPVYVARDLGAEFIVAVDVSRPPPEVGRTDPLALAGRAVGLLMHNARRDTIPPDVLVRPPIDPDHSGAIFPDDPTEFIEQGLEAVREADPQIPQRERVERLPAAPPRAFSALVVEVPDPALEALTRRVFRDVAPGPYSAEDVLTAVDHLYASGLVAGVWPRVEGGDPSSDEAVLTVRVDPLPRMTVAGAAGYENDRGGRIWAAVQRRVPLGRRPAEVGAAASGAGLERWVEGTVRVHSLRWPRVAWSLGGHLLERDVRLLEADPLPVQREVHRHGGWAGVEHRQAFRDWALTVLGRAEYVDVEEGPSGVSIGPFVRTSIATPPGQVVGTPTELEAELRFGEWDYGRAAFRTSVAVPLGRIRSAAVLDVAWTEPDAPPDALPALGDRRAMPGMRWGQERGRARAVAGLDLAHPIFLQGHARLRLRGGAAPDRMEAFGDEDAWVGGAALEGVWSSPLGPILVGVGWNTRGHERLDVSLGPRF